MVDEGRPSVKELLFLQIISMFQAAAMQQMGKIVDPVSGEVSRELEQAKVSIDILDVIKEKTQGNLTEAEKDFLDKVLFELHMNYVDEVKKPAADETEERKGVVDDNTRERHPPASDEDTGDSALAEDRRPEAGTPKKKKRK
ncbi:MAG: DUF1844 domain-containing protein [Candidatus Krumholzibacteria bacterium]|nr:DUF1844 domain-containing protein [Candidatus Krumholzibacteria bacterium]